MLIECLAGTRVTHGDGVCAGEVFSSVPQPLLDKLVDYMLVCDLVISAGRAEKGPPV